MIDNLQYINLKSEINKIKKHFLYKVSLEYKDIDNINIWLKNNIIEHKWKIFLGVLYMENKQDFILFKLRWL